MQSVFIFLILCLILTATLAQNISPNLHVRMQNNVLKMDLAQIQDKHYDITTRSLQEPNCGGIFIRIFKALLDFFDFLKGKKNDTTLGNHVWNDLNVDGIQNAGEPGMVGVTVKLKNSQNQVTGTTTTDSSGNYLFSGLNSGQYQLEFVKPTGYEFTLSNQGDDDALDSDVDSSGNTAIISISSGSKDTTIDAGMFTTASLGGFVWHDLDGDGIQDVGEWGINGFNILLKDGQNKIIATSTTGGNGNYFFNGLNPGQYKVEFVMPAGYDKFTLPNQGTDDTLDSDVVDIDGRTGKVIINLLSGSAITVDAGMFSTVLNLGDYVWNDSNENGIQDLDESGIAGITVKLKNSQDQEIGETTTDSSGKYLFSGLNPGQYKLEVLKPPGYQFTLANSGTNDALDSDFDSTGSISIVILSGTSNLVWDAGLYVVGS